MYSGAFEWLDSNGLVHTRVHPRMYVGGGAARGRRMAEMDRCLEHESLLCHWGRREEGGGSGEGEEGLDFCTRQIEI